MTATTNNDLKVSSCIDVDIENECSTYTLPTAARLPFFEGIQPATSNASPVVDDARQLVDNYPLNSHCQPANLMTNPEKPQPPKCTGQNVNDAVVCKTYKPEYVSSVTGRLSTLLSRDAYTSRLPVAVQRNTRDRAVWKDQQLWLRTMPTQRWH